MRIGYSIWPVYPAIPVEQLYSHMAKGIQCITPFSPKESTGDTDSIWTLFSHTGVYVMAIGLLIPTGLEIFSCYFLWWRPARLACWPLTPGNTCNILLWMIMYRQHPSIDVMARPHSLQDLMRIMTCVWSIYLHGQRVYVSSRCSH